MAILSKEEAQAILKKALSFSKADECEVTLSGNVGGNIRYARNEVSTSGAEENVSMSVESRFGKRSGVATINEFDDKSLEKVIRRSEEIARIAPESPEYIELLGPQTYITTREHFDTTAKIDPAFRAEAAAKSIKAAADKGLTAAGFLEHYTRFIAKMNNKGLFAYHPSTVVDFSVTMRTEDGTGSGYVTQDFSDSSKLDTAIASKIAADKAVGSRNAKALEPGKYTVILEPAASIDLLQNMFFNMDQRNAEEGRSFLSKAGGLTKLGEKLVDERINVYSDPTNPEVPSSPFAGDGRPQEKITWIDKGVVKNMYNSRYWAAKKGVKAVPAPGNVIMAGGNESLEDMIKSTKRGILVTRLWYIRTVDPQTLLYTGLTRDGTFYIENGKIMYPVKNFRFNESPVIMLNNLEALGKPQRISGSLIPPMKIRDFTFTSLSDAV
ncbi:putative Zn-dependent protease [Pontibacter ummariensis]|uniref:Predicted Zn-dependent protease or its inactivated homolog n=1 Tax=Pontibacter ummariensis TaxID=1610492 RepID=A0A239CRT4_9BACT|nr:TldD/PmbA family protein [Pontibacter ummariensis]PRY14884.1 putative Zn-dependent protease [Pontibacter ummariensis]SNS22361.1 Predicted Zn-dependent protease or its inactivated homolog [Pontibacter ummariensis]